MWGEILTVVAHTSIVWPRATVVQVDPARNLEVPVLDPCGTPTAGATSHYGLLECDYLSEAQTFPEKAAQFRKVLGNLSQIGGCATVSNALLRNSPMLEETLRFSIAQAVAHRVDFDALRGTGAASQIKGIVGSDGAITTSARGSNTAISWANILLVNASVLPSSKNRGIWCVSPTAEQEILEAGTTNTVGTGFVSPSRTGETMVDVLGRPMYVTDALPALNTTGDCVFIDPKYFLIVDGGLEIAVSTHANFRNGQTVFRFIQNISGAPWINSTLTLTDASTQVSPFVVLGPQ
jgi:HK97 family phage major capsid protein